MLHGANLCAQMHAQLSVGTDQRGAQPSLSRFFVAVRWHRLSVTTLAQLRDAGFHAHSKGPFSAAEQQRLETALQTYTNNRQQFEDGSFSDQHWGEGGGQTEDVLTWLVRSVGTRRTSTIAVEVKRLLATAAYPQVAALADQVAAAAAIDQATTFEEGAMGDNAAVAAANAAEAQALQLY